MLSPQVPVTLRKQIDPQFSRCSVLPMKPPEPLDAGEFWHAEVAHLDPSLECAPSRWLGKTLVIAPKSFYPRLCSRLLE